MSITPSEVHGIILAAGESKRFGSEKMLSDYRGKPVLQHALKAAAASGLAKVHVVINDRISGGAEIVNNFDSEKIDLILNPDYHTGMASSIQSGIRHIIKNSGSSDRPAVMILLGDMPDVDAALINAIIDLFRKSGSGICAPTFEDRTGHPVIFHPRYFDEILLLRGDVGCRDIISRNMDDVERLPIEEDGSQVDIDFKCGEKTTGE